MLKPIASVNWDLIAQGFKEKGFVFHLDKKPMPSGSGTINGYWFQFFWFGGKDGLFSICLTRIPEMCGSITGILETLSEVVFEGTKPYVRYNRASIDPFLVTYEWISEDIRGKIKKLKSDSEITNLRILKGEKLP